MLHALFADLASSLPAARDAIGEGRWSDQPRSGGIVDYIWEGTLESRTPFAGIVLTGSDARGWKWEKSQRAIQQSPLRITLSGHAPQQRFVGFSSTFHGACPATLPVRLAARADCVIDVAKIPPGVPHVVAAVDGAACVLVLLPGKALETGANGLWRVREEHTAGLAPTLVELLTRGRTGELQKN